MRLSKLQILGFKSFPQKTELHFDRGMTAIVGPNGCGKTNILDAIRWVLGEQRTTLLRSSKMEDVIFNGTKDLKPLGMAEVTLIIDNYQGVLPTDYNQVTVTRRLFRSGESEYLLNKVPCRLKDITELFLDTGVGIHAYSVIQPEMVEAILSDRAEERRFLFEEAAGITKYKLRRREAERKLEHTENDLLRLGDILSEVEKQVNSLARQKGKAERFKRLTEEIREFEIKLGQHEFLVLRARVQDIDQKLTASKNQAQEAGIQLEKQEAQIEELKLKLLEKERESAQLQKSKGELSEKAFEFEREISISRERRSNLERLVAKNKEEIENLRSRHSSVVSQKDEKDEGMNQLSAEIQAKKEACDREEKAVLAHDERLQQIKEELEQVSSDWQRSNEDLNRAKSEKESVRTQVEELKQRQATFSQEIESNQQRINEISERLKSLASAAEGRRRFLETRTGEAKQLEEKIKEGQSELTALAKEEGNLRSLLEGGKTRLEMLRQIVEHYEGYGKGEKSVLAARGELTGIIDTVANLITTKPEYVTAIESALGESLQFIVCQTTDSALKAIDYLRERRGGRATFLPLDRIRTWNANPSRINLDGHSEAVGFAADFVDCKADFKKTVDVLLGNVILVKTMDQAMELAPRIGTGFYLATLDGSMIRADAAFSGGSPTEVSLLGRELEIRRLEQEVSELKGKLSAIEVQKERRESETEYLQRLLSQTSAEAEESAVQIQQSEIELKTLEFERNTYRKRQDELEGLLQQTVQQTDQLIQKVETRDQSTLQLEGQKEKLSSLLEEKKQLQEETEALLSETFRKANHLKIELVSLQGKEEQLKSEYLRLCELISEIDHAVLAKEKECDGFRKEIEQIGTTINVREEELKDSFERIEKVNAQINSLQQDQAQWQESLTLKEKEVRAFRGEKEKAVDQLHQQEKEQVELSSQAKSIKERIWEEYRFDLDQLESKVPVETEDLQGLKESLNVLKERLNATGPVNLLALEEYQSAKERFDFLRNQVADLTEAKQTLTSTITKINQTARTLFSETFEKIQTNFQKVFQELFEGGETELKLLELEDPLESPVQISARPFGKRLINISQLSGGEKALTAIALLFAIYLVKPSPFCIFDEVDAPLDDANIARYLKLIRHFSSNTQFILITHNKLTMEAADILYGVTMEQPGISRIVSVKFEKQEVVAK
ncbi:MAG: chromosome segregation protein SMC [Candidatus Zixiibacteriota bacterium]